MVAHWSCKVFQNSRCLLRPSECLDGKPEESPPPAFFKSLYLVNWIMRGAVGLLIPTQSVARDEGQLHEQKGLAERRTYGKLIEGGILDNRPMT
jgi:hypothetical protein